MLEAEGDRDSNIPEGNICNTTTMLEAEEKILQGLAKCLNSNTATMLEAKENIFFLHL